MIKRPYIIPRINMSPWHQCLEICLSTTVRGALSHRQFIALHTELIRTSLTQSNHPRPIWAAKLAYLPAGWNTWMLDDVPTTTEPIAPTAGGASSCDPTLLTDEKDMVIHFTLQLAFLQGSVTRKEIEKPFFAFALDVVAHRWQCIYGQNIARMGNFFLIALPTFLFFQFTVKYFIMRLYFVILIQFLLIFVRSDTASTFDNEDSMWSLSDLDSSPSTFLSDDAGDQLNMDSISSNEPNWDFSSHANDFDMGQLPASISATDPSQDLFANAGGSCMSEENNQDFQSIGKPRPRLRLRNGPACRVKPKAEDPLDRPTSKPIEIPNTFTNPGGDPLGFFYPSENDDECPPSLYGNRKTPMCDSGFGDDFMRYSVLGFTALDMIEECLPCIYIHSIR